MNRRVMAAILCAWVLSLIGVAAWAQTSAPPSAVFKPDEPFGEVMTGDTIGFQRVAALPNRDGKVVGKWMVKVDGNWRETKAPVGVVR